jgi:endogenous inhibitor of DNA gyrase (YacG/DUF329 family)
MPKVVKQCPVCGKDVKPNGKSDPFCGDRCRTIDLGNWSSEKYLTHSPLTEADEQLDSAQRSNRDEE